MSAAKHTPGPWKVERAENLESEWTCYANDCAQSTWQQISDGAGNAVALVVDASQRYSYRPSFDADACLIAAAPELLAALAALHDDARLVRDGVMAASALSLRIQEAAAAITKATGSAA